MASTSAVFLLLLLFAGLFTVKAGDDCKSYYKGNKYNPRATCGFFEHCCGSCDNRYCCSSEFSKLSYHEQDVCDVIHNRGFAVTGSIIGSVIFFVIILFIACCSCPSCCLYQTCRNRRPVAGAQVIAVTNTNVIQQQPGVQYPQYQPVPTQSGYSQPMQMTPYQGQPCAPGAPPPYHVATSPGYPTSQSAYDGSQAMYPMQPPVQPGPAYMASDTSTQLAYNPAYMQPPNTASPGYPTSQSAYGGGQAMYPMQPPAQPGPVYTPPGTSNQPAYNPAYMQPPKTGH